jgi:hypothetical protein
VLNRQSVNQPRGTSGPLLGQIDPEKDKPKLREGLIGEMQRREKEKEMRRQNPDDFLIDLERQYFN